MGEAAGHRFRDKKYFFNSDAGPEETWTETDIDIIMESLCIIVASVAAIQAQAIYQG